MKSAEAQVLSEFFLALQGEQCLFTTPKINEQGYRIVDEVVVQVLSKKIGVNLEMLFSLSNCVKSIELWKQSQAYAHSSSSNDIATRQGMANEPFVLDSVKKTIVESIIGDYNIYLAKADQMRIEHISRKKEHLINDMFGFVLEWHKRLHYLQSLLTHFDNCSGMEAMNILFKELTLNCIRDWSYGMVERALRKSSIELRKICEDWLLEGHLQCNKNRWFIKLQCSSDSSNRSRTSHRASMTSFNSTNCSINRQEDAQLEIDVSSVEAGNRKELFLPAIIDWEVVPASLKESDELLNLVLDIGRKVHFLKVLRSHRSYEYKHDIRKQFLADSPADVWCVPSKRGKFVIAIQKIHSIVSEDMLQELLERGRIMDHLSLIHGYFFMLRGDLLTELVNVVFDNAPKSSYSVYTPFSSHKRFSHKSKIAEKFLNDALARCSPPMHCADLKYLLAGEKLPNQKRSEKSLIESFSLNFDANATKEPNIMSEFLSRDMLKIYQKIFRIACNLQLQRTQLNCTAHDFMRSMQRKLFLSKETCFLYYFILGKLQIVRLFLDGLANYFFEEVLLLESTSIFERMQRETNPHELIYGHQQLLRPTMKALFIYQGADSLNSATLNCIRRSAALIEAVSVLCECSTNSLFCDEIGPTDAKFHIDSENKQPQPENRKKSIEMENFRSNLQVLCHRCEEFKDAKSNLRHILSKQINDGTNKASPYWSKMFSLLFDPMNP